MDDACDRGERMSREILEQIEFEKNKREILKQNTQAQSRKETKSSEHSKITEQPKKNEQSKLGESQFNSKAHKKSSREPSIQIESATKYAWEYEIENYRKFRNQMRFILFGAVCGILSLILTIGLHFNQIKGFLMKF